LWCTIAASWGTRAASFTFLSVSKKKRASARRGRTTRSLPRTILDGSASLMLLTMRKRWVSLPPASKSGKYFWFWRIVSTRHSAGTARNSSSKLPA
jgi:hypothetical protein